VAKPALKFHEHDEGTSARATQQAQTAASAMSNAEEICRTAGARLTPIRRKVLEALFATHKPLGAYDLAEMLGPKGRRLAPITVYRALDFLLEQGLAHRIESRNAFVACAHEHGDRGVLMFLICESCGSVGEAVSDAVGTALARAADGAGFAPRAQVIEVAGQCAHCRAA
jgi:Fur family transcriptional regulator, zinc uptake regulator